LGPGTVTIGHDDSEAGDSDIASASDVAGHEFGWDNEHPKREMHVDEFKIEWRPVTNAQFYAFYVGVGKDKVELPTSWVEVNGEIQV
jgi:formylglycine-generating enzyme required for sulfatase activity